MCSKEGHVHTEGYVDVVVPEVSPAPHSTLQSSACKALASLLGSLMNFRSLTILGLFVKAKVHKPYLLS